MLKFSKIFSSEIIKTIYSDILGLLVISFKDGRVQSIACWLENEDNEDYEDAEILLVKGHLTISKAIKRVVEEDFEEKESEEEKDLMEIVMNAQT